MLTAGEEGDLILWDVSSGRELRRYPSIADQVEMLCLHPRDPWALVVTGWRQEQQVHLLDLGSGRHRRLWQRELASVSFDHAGTRIALLFDDQEHYPRQELVVYRDAALLAAQLPNADLCRDVRDFAFVLFTTDDRGDEYE